MRCFSQPRPGLAGEEVSLKNSYSAANMEMLKLKRIRAVDQPLNGSEKSKRIVTECLYWEL